MAGYEGKILRINLTKRSVSVLDTELYEEYGGGNGMGTAIFWDLCQDKTVSGFDPRNVVTIMASPLSGTPTPGASRLEINGINVFSYPVEWFSRTNIGGFFSTMLKCAGWDGIVIEGKADKPVWVNILNDKVTIEDARSLWGHDTPTTQEEIWRRVTGRDSFGEWMSLGEAQTTQGPSILCIAPGGESLSRMGTIQTGIGMGGGQGGFGSVWGSKNLKAISVVGTGSVGIADLKAFFAAREWLRGLTTRKLPFNQEGRQTSCSGCFQKCRSRVRGGAYQDAKCLGSINATDINARGRSGSDIIQMYGLNMNDLTGLAFTDGVYLKKLYQAGIIGPGKAIDTAPLPMEKYGGTEFTEALCRAIVNREGIGADLADGIIRAAKKWGRLEQDLANGFIHKAQWGYTWHWSLPFVEQAYGSLMGERDTNEHAFSHNRLWAQVNSIGYDKLPAEKIAEMMSKKMIPYTDDPLMLDFTWQEANGSKMEQALATGIYSKHKAKMIAWHRHYSRFWIESVLYCDHLWPVFFDPNTPGYIGTTPEYETQFFNAVTGKSLTFADSMEIGRKIWNLNRAIWVLQGRHRDMERFAEFMYTPLGSLTELKRVFPAPLGVIPLTVYENGKWRMADLDNMYLDKAGVEQWKTHFYQFEGWDPATGWPTRKTLEELGLRKVADTLESAGRLGSPET